MRRKGVGLSRGGGERELMKKWWSGVREQEQEQRREAISTLSSIHTLSLRDSSGSL